jgi:hypothetical protein
LLAGELILTASELLYAALHDGKIKRHRFKRNSSTLFAP